MGLGAMRTASDRIESTRHRFAELVATVGNATIDMRHLWCGWLSFGFSGTVSVMHRTLTEDIRILASDGSSIICETAYCSSVLCDLRDDLLRARESGFSVDSYTATTRIFCDAEECGNYEVRVSPSKVAVWSDFCDSNQIEEACVVLRNDGGNYVEDLLATLALLGENILARCGDDREDILAALAMFCDRMVPDDDGSISAVDATTQDAEEILRSVTESLT